MAGGMFFAFVFLTFSSLYGLSAWHRKKLQKKNEIKVKRGEESGLEMTSVLAFHRTVVQEKHSAGWNKAPPPLTLALHLIDPHPPRPRGPRRSSFSTLRLAVDFMRDCGERLPHLDSAQIDFSVLFFPPCIVSIDYLYSAASVQEKIKVGLKC